MNETRSWILTGQSLKGSRSDFNFGRMTLSTELCTCPRPDGLGLLVTPLPVLGVIKIIKLHDKALSAG